MKESLYAAADIGATGIKMAAAVYDGRKLRIVDTYSEPNLPKVKDGHEFADIGHMLKTIRDGLGWLGENGRFVSLGIDTYGNGYGILDAEGKLIQEPYHYRDRRIDGIMDQVHRCFTDWQLYEQMGNYPVKTRALFHLYRDVLDCSPNIMRGERFLPLSSLLEYLITGQASVERTIASVLYLLEQDGRQWNYEVFRKLGIPEKLFGPLSEPGRPNGSITRSFAAGAGIEGVPVISVAGHDTESALMAAPGLDKTKVFVSLGTSFIFGARVKAPVVNRESFHDRFKNMRGVGGTYSLCKDFPGFWILERCMEQWRKQVPRLDYEAVCAAAEKVRDNRTFIDISDDRFRVSGDNLPETIREYCLETGQKCVEGVGDTSRCLFESYALYLKWNIRRLSRITGETYRELVAVNGGVRNRLLMQMFADAAGIPVVAGSPLASVGGNLLMQLYAAGEAKTLWELEQIASATWEPVVYESSHLSRWDEWLEYLEHRGLGMYRT